MQSTCHASDLAVVPVSDVNAFMRMANQAATAMREGNLALGVVIGERVRLAAEAASVNERLRLVQETLDRECLLEVGINPESRVKVDAGPAETILSENRWRYYFLKVVNEAGVTAPLRLTSDQLIESGGRPGANGWLEIELFDGGVLPDELSGERVDYRLVRLRTSARGKRAAVIAADVGQATADIGFRNDVLLTFTCEPANPGTSVSEPTSRNNLLVPRPPTSDADLRRWLENMVWYHGYGTPSIRAATGLSQHDIRDALARFDIRPETKPPTTNENLKLLPYPGGKHPRIGFVEGAVRPHRETKASVFAPWDPTSYVVLDVPEAIFSNLGLLYLAHRHVPTIWEASNQELESLEWTQKGDTLQCERTLPNAVHFGVRLEPTPTAIRMEMWLTNGTAETLTNLRVQNCVQLKCAKGFEEQTNDNKVYWGPYAACHNAEGDRWVISGWSPIDRVWGNVDCPCLHADPQFPDCPPGQTKRLQGWLSFYSGSNVHRELLRIEGTGWHVGRIDENKTTEVRGVVLDDDSSRPIPARIYIRGDDGSWHFVDSAGGDAVRYERRHAGAADSDEVHTTLSADPFVARLPPGEYTFRIERGKEYLPDIQRVKVGKESLQRTFRLRRWINMAERGWYSGDTHVHRSLEELPNVMLAEDLNVALPLTYWVTQSGTAATDTNGHSASKSNGLMHVDRNHVIYPLNTEYEIASVDHRRHLLGAVLALNHREPLDVAVPPVGELAAAVHRQGGLLDLDKHSWPWSLMTVPIMDVDLFELANNHMWQTHFALQDWTLDTAAPFMNLETTDEGFTEAGWIDFGFQTYYLLLNCGFRMRVSAGTASGVHPVPLGFGRVYVHLPDGFDYDQWIAGLDEGRTFVTTGPMLDVQFNGLPPGHTFRLDSSASARVHLTGTAESMHPLGRIEIVKNGKPFQVLSPSNAEKASGGYASDIDCVVDLDSSSWLAVRCFEAHPDNRVRFAHTNPVFVDIAGKPLRPRRAEVSYLIRRMEEEIESNRQMLGRDAIAEYQQALDIYKDLEKQAQ